MDTVEFLRRIWPARGLYIIARLTSKGFRHQVCDTIEEAAAYALQFDAQGVPTYHACAAYRERDVVTVKPNGEEWHQVRIHKNVRALKCFWMDLDVKPGVATAFESQEDACGALFDFCQATSLPMPMVVSSGGGIHLYWTLTDEILPEQWKQTAEGLKALCAHHKFRADPAVTSDSARVLRPIGTHNRKVSGSVRPVELVADADSLDYKALTDMVAAGVKRAGLKPPADPVRKVEGKTEELNQAFQVKQDFPPCSGIKVAERCAQLGKMRDTRGVISEPHWYAGIQLLCHSIEGDALIHAWSNGHANYSEEETNKKIKQIRDQALGPTLCSTFSSRNPGACDGCPFSTKISSPVQLGTHVPSAPAPVAQVKAGNITLEVALPPPPVPFTRGEKGGIYIEEDGITHKIYEYDLYPTEMAYDEQLGYETTRWRHFLPKEGWSEFTLRSALLARPVDFEAALRDHHVQPLIRNKIAMYGDAYTRKLRTDIKMRRLFTSQGWKADDTEFVLGDKLYKKGEAVQAGFSHGKAEFLAPFHSRGDLETWKTLTWALGHPGFEPHAFMLLLAFASPLLKLAGREGFTVNALGESGVGKSTMAQFMSSVYSDPKGSWIGRKDTDLARVQRFGAHFSLPVYMDESTTIPNKELRDLVYMVPTGKSRSSMTKDYKLRQGAEWATIFVTSSNESLQSKLQIEKQNAEAESLRLFEFVFPRVADFGPIAKMIPGVIAANYGVAGEAYIQRLVDQRDEVAARLATIVAEAETAFGMQDKERFWSQAIALTVYGGELAREWGIIDFDPTAIRPWLLRETIRMRRDVTDSMVGSIAILGEYLNEHIGERLVVTSINAGLGAAFRQPNRELSQRFEKDRHLLYFPRSHVKRWLDARHFGYNDVKDDLYQRGVLLNPGAMKILGAGTDMTGGQVACWKIKTDHADLGGVVE